jgi:hypothetical protein
MLIPLFPLVAMVTENCPSVTGTTARAIASTPSRSESNMTTVPEAFGETTPLKLSGATAVLNALAGSWVAEGDVNAI